MVGDKVMGAQKTFTKSRITGYASEFLEALDPKEDLKKFSQELSQATESNRRDVLNGVCERFKTKKPTIDPNRLTELLIEVLSESRNMCDPNKCTFALF